MKVSELTVTELEKYLRIDDTENDIIANDLTHMLDAAKSYVKSYTGQDDTYIEEHADITIAVMSVVADMYENKQTELNNQTYKNKTVESILKMHSITYV